MVSRLDHQLIPTRFLMLMSHFIAVLMVYYTKQHNILASLPIDYTSSSYNDATSSVLAACWLSIICFVVEFAGLFSGVSMFMLAVNGFGIFIHFLGGILVCWYIVEAWYYTTIWYLFVFFNLLPAIIEAIAFIRVFCCRVVAY